MFQRTMTSFTSDEIKSTIHKVLEQQKIPLERRETLAFYLEKTINGDIILASGNLPEDITQDEFDSLGLSVRNSMSKKVIPDQSKHLAVNFYSVANIGTDK